VSIDHSDNTETISRSGLDCTGSVKSKQPTIQSQHLEDIQLVTLCINTEEVFKEERATK